MHGLTNSQRQLHGEYSMRRSTVHHQRRLLFSVKLGKQDTSPFTFCLNGKVRAVRSHYRSNSCSKIISSCSAWQTGGYVQLQMPKASGEFANNFWQVCWLEAAANKESGQQYSLTSPYSILPYTEKA